MDTINNNILILEPNEGVRESLKLILEVDYNLLFSNTADEAEKYLASHKIDLFIMEVDR